MKKLIILLISVFLISGCSYTEINDLAIASSIGIDYEDGQYKLTAQIMDIKSSDSGMTKESALIYESTGKTIAKAINNFSVRYPKNVYLGHLEFIILSKEASEKKLEDIFDYFLRSPEARTSSFVVISNEESANDIMNPKNEQEESFPTESLKSVLMDATKRNGTVNDTTLEEFLSFYLKTGIDPVVPLIKKTENKGITASATIIEEMIPVSRNKVHIPLTKEEAIAYNTINNNYDEVVIDCKYKSKDFGALIYNPKSSVEVKIKNSQIDVTVNVKFESKINEMDKKINLINKDVHNKIKQEINNEMKIYAKELINYSKENNVDTLGIGSQIYKNYFKEYDKYKYKNLYEEANINIKIDNKMYRHGNINKGAA